MLFTILAFLIILGFLIFAHEMGHFLVARFLGVKAEEFGFGFPPRIFGLVLNNKKKKWELIRGNKEIQRKNTIYSFNWIPLGGFVKIKGENEKQQEKKVDPDSFAAKKIWQKILILAAGVAMNFLAAALILSVGFFHGLPEVISDADSSLKNTKVQILEIAPNSPAKEMGLKPGDQVTALSLPGEDPLAIQKIQQAIDFLKINEGREILMEIKRGDDIYRLKGTPRVDHPQEQGALGIVLIRTALVSYPPFTAIQMGFTATLEMTRAMLEALGGILRDLIFKGKAQADVAGPVGIVILTNQAAEMGLAYLLQFAAILSINLAIINILPFPALDGGRIFFLLIEKIKKSPVSQELEGKIHLTGFYILIAFMIFITIRDVFKFQDKFQVLFEKIGRFL